MAKKKELQDSFTNPINKNDAKDELADILSIY